MSIFPNHKPGEWIVNYFEVKSSSELGLQRVIFTMWLTVFNSTKKRVKICQSSTHVLLCTTMNIVQCSCVFIALATLNTCNSRDQQQESERERATAMTLITYERNCCHRYTWWMSGEKRENCCFWLQNKSKGRYVSNAKFERLKKPWAEHESNQNESHSYNQTANNNNKTLSYHFQRHHNHISKRLLNSTKLNRSTQIQACGFSVTRQ